MKTCNLYYDSVIYIHKANNVLGTIKCTFNARDPNEIRLLYTTLVQPILDYTTLLPYGTIFLWETSEI